MIKNHSRVAAAVAAGAGALGLAGVSFIARRTFDR